MKAWIICLLALLFIPVSAHSQDWQGLIMIDSRTGYSTNTILTPFYGKWDRTTGSGYGFISPMGRLQKLGERLSADVTAGGVYEPFFDNRETLTGGFGLFTMRYRFNSRFSAGLETGGSTFKSETGRRIGWVQPMAAWSPTLFSQVRLKAGSTYMVSESDVSEGEFSERRRFNQYGIEYEVWPAFNWQIRTGLYGNLDEPAGIRSFLFQVDHTPASRFTAGVRLNAEQYQFSRIVNGTGGNVDPGGTGGPGGAPGNGPPFGSPGGGETVPEADESMLINETDRIFRAGVSLRYQLHHSFSVMLNADRMELRSSVSDEKLLDYQLSAGFRYSFRPSFGRRSKAEPRWRQNGDQTLSLRIKHSGEGRLYITGDFNDWDQPGLPLTKQTENRYAARLSLEPGAYEYKILLIDGNEERWIEFSDETYTVRDGFGGVNGLVFID